MTRMRTAVPATLLPYAAALVWSGLFPSAAFAVQAFQESAGQVVMEAERYDSKIPRNGKDWIFETRITSFSGTGHMTALPDSTVVQKTN